MALMTKTQIETMTDHVAAMIKDELAGANNAAFCPSGGGLWNLVDAVNNADIELALGQSADNLDVLRFDQTNLLKTYIAPKYGAFLLNLQSQIRDDETYATLDAYLTGVSAKVSPYIQDIASSGNVLGASLSPVNVFTPAIGAKSYDAVFSGTDGSLDDETTDAGSSVASDVNVFVANNDALYLGLNSKPTGTYDYITTALGTNASTDVGLTVSYWNGTAWVAVTNNDADTTGDYANLGTQGFTKSGVIRYQVPSNWSRVNQDASGASFPSDKTPRYYLRLTRTTGTVATKPVVSMIQNGAGVGLVVITGTNTATLLGGDGINTALYDATNTLTLRSLVAPGASVTSTVTYTNRAGTTAQSQSLGAFSTPTLGTSYTGNTVSDGVAAVTGIAVTTTATSGILAIENSPLRTETK